MASVRGKRSTALRLSRRPRRTATGPAATNMTRSHVTIIPMTMSDGCDNNQGDDRLLSIVADRVSHLRHDVIVDEVPQPNPHHQPGDEDENGRREAARLKVRRLVY